MDFLQYHEIDTLDIIREKLMRDFSLALPDDVGYWFASVWPGVKGTSPRSRSDYVRCDHFSRNPDDAWGDSDLIIKKFWRPPADGKVYANKSLSVIFCNGQSDVFASLVRDYSPDMVSGWLQKLVWGDRYKERFALIPDDHFMHLDLCIMAKLSKLVSTVGNKYCTVTRDDAGVLRLTLKV